MSLLSKIPLVLVVAIAATLELVLNRIGVHLMTGAAERSGTLFKVVDSGGLYTFYLTGLLAMVAFSWAVVVQIRDRRLLKTPDRVVFTVLSALFLPMVAMGLLFSLPTKVAPHLNTTFGLLLVAMLVGFLRQRAPLRAKLGLFYLTAPLLLHCYWLMTQQITVLAPEGRHSELPGQLFVVAEHLVVVGAFAAFFFFGPFQRAVNEPVPAMIAGLASILIEPIPVVAAVLVTSGVALLARYRYLKTAQAAYYGLGLNLPPPSAHGLMHLAALFLFVVTLGALIMRGKREREVALGLYLVAVSGFHLQLPYQFLLTLLGMMQVARGSLDEDSLGQDAAQPSVFPAPEDWKAYLQRLAAACTRPPGGGEVVMLQNGGQQVAYIRGKRDDVAFTLRLQQKGGVLQRLEVTVGKQPKDPAPIGLSRRAGIRGKRVTMRSSGPRVKLHSPVFDEQFDLTWGADRPTEILRRHTDQVQRVVHGWLGIWPGECVHYVALPGPDGWPVPLAEVIFSADDATIEELEELVALMEAVGRGAGVA